MYFILFIYYAYVYYIFICHVTGSMLLEVYNTSLLREIRLFKTVKMFIFKKWPFLAIRSAHVSTSTILLVPLPSELMLSNKQLTFFTRSKQIKKEHVSNSILHTQQFSIRSVNRISLCRGIDAWLKFFIYFGPISLAANFIFIWMFSK